MLLFGHFIKFSCNQGGSKSIKHAPTLGCVGNLMWFPKNPAPNSCCNHRSGFTLTSQNHGLSIDRSLKHCSHSSLGWRWDLGIANCKGSQILGIKRVWGLQKWRNDSSYCSKIQKKPSNAGQNLLQGVEERVARSHCEFTLGVGHPNFLVENAKVTL